MNRKRASLAAGAVLVLAATALGTTATGSVAAGASGGTVSPHARGGPGKLPGGFKHLVVIYEENHSFDNLYGDWGQVGGRHVEGRADADQAHTTQVDQHGSPFTCLFQDDVNLASPPDGPLASTCHDDHQVTGRSTAGFDSHFPNVPFPLDDYLGPDATTCPEPGTAATNGTPAGSGKPGGCTRDLVHRFYQEQYALDGGRQDRYVTASDAAGLSMGYYDTTELPIYRYLHSAGAPHYVIADHFFQAAFGGSFLNHQWLIAARSPYDDPSGSVPANKLRARNTVLGSDGMPVTGLNPVYPMYSTQESVLDGEDTVACLVTGADRYDDACGRYAVNTVQPSSPPYSANATARFIPLIDDLRFPNIGDRLSAADISWNWYSGGWNDAKAGNPGKVFQYHHQPFNYFANYAEGAPGRVHLRDETEFVSAARTGTLPTVSFVKPYGTENEHPGYASEPNGNNHLVQLIQGILAGPEGDDTLVVVTYDEFGGQWDHVPPPKVDRWGPGTRIPALLLANSFSRSTVDHKTYDTTSILALIERSFGLAPLGDRDRKVRDLAHAVRAGHP